MGFLSRLTNKLLGELADAFWRPDPQDPHDLDSRMFADDLLIRDYNERRNEQYWDSLRNNPDIQFAIFILEAYDRSLGKEPKIRNPITDTWYTEIRYILKNWENFPETLQIGNWTATKAELFKLLNPITFPVPPKWELPPRLRPRSRK